MLPVIVKKNQPEIIKLGSPEIGEIHLEKRSSISVGERMQIDEYELQKNKSQIIATKLLRRIAIDRGISTEEAQDLLSPKKSANNTEVDNSDVVLDYIEDLAELNSVSAIAELSTTVFIVHFVITSRAAYALNFPLGANAEDASIKINPVPFQLDSGRIIKVGSQRIIVAGNHPKECENIKVQPISQAIDEDAIGYLMTKSGKQYLTGSDEWTLEQTKSLDENLVNEIYKFYENERRGWKSLEPAPAPTENEELGEQPQLTGLPSTGESKAIESQTRDLVVGIAS